jgi:hypothetical protein
MIAQRLRGIDVPTAILNLHGAKVTTCRRAWLQGGRSRLAAGGVEESAVSSMFVRIIMIPQLGKLTTQGRRRNRILILLGPGKKIRAYPSPPHADADALFKA